MADGLPSALGDIGSDSIKDASISNADLANDAASGAKVSAGFAVVGLGSPTGYGNSVQIGEFVASAGSVAEVDFANEFAAAPTVLVNAVGGLASHPSASAGSFVINCETASASGVYIAIGSGRV